MNKNKQSTAPAQWTQEKIQPAGTASYRWIGDIMVPRWEQKVSRRIKR